MKKILFVLPVMLLAGLFLEANAQCETWNNSPKKEEAETAHVLYRQFIKAQDFENAFPQWEKAYSIAPSADGQRSTHFSDGVDLYMKKYQEATDPSKKKEYEAKILELYDQWVNCYPKEAAYARGRQAYNMFYTLNSDYNKLAAVLKEGMEKGGKQSEYIILDPYAHVVVHLFETGKMTADEARAINLKLNEIADYNIENNKTFSQYFDQGKQAMNATFTKIENDIFDCDYFKNKYLPKYEEDPENPDVYREVYKYLIKGGCDKTDPIVREIAMKDSIYVMTKFYAENPGAYANALYKEGKYQEALAQYEVALENTDDAEKQADYYLGMASIEFRKLNHYSSARALALKAAKLKPNWGQPYILIGDMYASTSSSCGSDPFEKQVAVLAAIDKYAYARSIDNNPEVQSDANSKIARYSEFKPDKGEAHMRGIAEGQVVTVNCWIGESVKVRFK